MQSPASFSAHSDVLEAPVPETAAAKASLLEELKRRGRAAVGAGQWPDAAALYARALQVCAGDNEQQQQQQQQQQRSILNANLSLCHAKMHHFDKAVETARAATEQDAAYVKGWWRLGQAHAALGQFDPAARALQRALRLDAGNKALQKELAKNQAALEKQKQNLRAEREKMEQTKETATATKTTTVVKESSGSGSSSKKEAKDGRSSNEMDVDDDDDDDDEKLFSKSDAVRGYKIVNGKKTSYFHNELSEDAAKLIGDIAPKKIDSSAAPQPMEPTEAAGAAAAVQAGTSAWNKAGTWEEKDCTKWALDSLKEALTGTNYTLPASSPAPDAVLTVSKAKVTGHASVAAVRGKKRYIYEMDVTVDWKFEHGDVEATGTMRFPDIDGTCALGDGYDVSDFIVTHADDPNVRPVLNTFCHQQGLREALHESVDNWVRKFKETY